jgi:hypothetical protein
MHFCFYPKDDYGCPHVMHCPHLGGAALGTLDYWTRWHTLTYSPNTNERVAGIQSHECVDRLEPWASF